MRRAWWMLAILSVPAAAQLPEAGTLDGAARLGTALYRLDRAAWIGTDAMKAAMGADLPRGPGGWVVEGGDAGLLTVTFYRVEGASNRAFFVATMRDRALTGGERVDRPLTSAQERLAQARAAAAAEARTRGYAPCTPAPFNTVVLPGSGSGPVPVYLLSAQVKANEYPLGGHFRIVVGEGGKVLASRAYTRSCLNITHAKDERGKAPAGLVVSHLLDPVPTEVHVFTSYTARLPVYVATADKRLWRVTGGRIARLSAHR